MNLNRIITKITLPIITLFVVFGFVFIQKASALTISPARIEVSGDAGTTITKDITLYNDSKNGTETYYVSYSNFEAQGETGSPKFVEPKNDLGTWMTTPGESFTVEAGGSKIIPLTITIPKDAYAGGHFSVVFFGNNPNAKDGGQVSVGAKTGTLVLLTVNGDVLEAGGLADFKTKDSKIFYNSLPISFQYRFKNDGNDRVKPEGDITIHNMVYFPTAHIDANAVSGNILPHSTRLFDIDWTKSDSKVKVSNTAISSFFERASYQWENFAVGPYIAKIDLSYGTEGNHSSKYAFFFVFPWQLLIIIFVILVIVFFIGKKLIKRYNKYIIKKARIGKHTQSDAHHD